MPGALARNLVLLALKPSDGQQQTFKCLNIQYIMATMLSYCKSRDLLWDPRKDILYLCRNENVAVQRIRMQLNTKEVKEMFLGTSFFSRLHTEDQRLCYRLLLDTEPPPIMAVTPPAPQVSKSEDPELSRPQPKKDPRTSHSRYRNVSGQRSSSGGALSHRTANEVRPESIDHLQDPRKISDIVDLQTVRSAKPLPVSAAAATKQARRSMPNLAVANNAVPILHASAQGNKGFENYKQQISASQTIQTSNQPILMASFQNQEGSQFGYGVRHQPARMIESIDQSLDQEPIVNRSESTKTDSSGTPVHGIQSQKGSLHVVSPEGEDPPRQQYIEDESISRVGRLHLVGTEGMCGTAEVPQRMAQSQSQHQRNRSAPPPQTSTAFVFELDATPLVQGKVIAELPADSIASNQAEHSTTETFGPPYGVATSRPLYSRKMSAPFEVGALPASLVAGGLASHLHRQSLGHSKGSDEAVFGFSTSQTNAYRYSSYVYTHIVGPEGRDASLDEGSASAYKAYRPFAAPDKQHDVETLVPADGSRHKRNVSGDSAASHDSMKLAKEYQELLYFEEGYGSH